MTFISLVKPTFLEVKAKKNNFQIMLLCDELIQPWTKVLTYLFDFLGVFLHNVLSISVVFFIFTSTLDNAILN